MVTALLERARQLRATIDTNAAESAGDAIPDRIVDACKEAGFFGSLVPREVGGAELAISDSLDLFAELSYADGSTGWCLMAASTAAAFFGAYCNDDFCERMFANGVPVVAGQFAPRGLATQTGTGFHLVGDYSFGSGLNHADWVGAGAFSAVPEGSPAEFRCLVVPLEQVELRGNWDVLGLQATASWDYHIDIEVPHEATFEFFAPTRHHGGPMYDLGVIILTEIGHAGWAMGMIRRALDEALEIARGRQRMTGKTVIADDPRFRFEYATAESRFRSSEMWCRAAFADAENAALAGEPIDPAFATRITQATTFMTQQGADIVRNLYLWCGTEALRDGPLQRCFRDIHAGSQHAMVSPRHTYEYAELLLAQADDAAVT